MRVFIDGEELPAGVEVELSIRPDRPTVHLRAPVTSQELLARLLPKADDNVHAIEWRADQTLVAQAHARLQGRFVVRTGASPDAAIYELWGPAWGPPPNYNQFMVVSSGGPAGTGEPASPTPSGAA